MCSLFKTPATGHGDAAEGMWDREKTGISLDLRKNLIFPTKGKPHETHKCPIHGEDITDWKGPMGESRNGLEGPLKPVPFQQPGMLQHRPTQRKGGGEGKRQRSSPWEMVVVG